MRLIIAASLAATLAACSTPGMMPARVTAEADPQAAPAAPAPVADLPAQRLQPGQCASFLFGARQPFPFVVFEDETARVVKLVHGGEIYEIDFADQGGAFIEGQDFERVYAAPDDALVFTLSGRVGAETADGYRLEDVILAARQPDGTRTVRPLAGVRRCDDG